MDVTVVASPTAPHQQQHANAICKGFELHGIKCKSSPHSRFVNSDTVVCWGWRNGEHHKRLGRRVLVLERGYIGDRFAWTSLGWNGLNGRAIMPVIGDPSRFARFFPEKLEPRRSGGEYSLIIGQVPQDAALQGRELGGLYRDSVKEAKASYGLPAWFRPHPRARLNSYPNDLKVFWREGDLREAILGARSVITFNSNTAVESVLAGVDTVSMDVGSMAWEVTSHKIGEASTSERQAWANRLAWKQWKIEEIEDGSAVGHLLSVMP